MRLPPEADASGDRSSSLAGKTVLVTGPAGPLAPAIAQAASHRGARVALSVPSPSPAATREGVILDLDGPPGAEVDADQLFEPVLAQFSALDALIAVVASEPVGALHELSLGRWGRCVADPLRLAFWLARRAVEEFLAARNRGRLVFVVAPARAIERNEVLETAMLSFARSIALEYGPRGLACNVVLPTGDALLPIVETTLFLASGEASFISGESVVVHT